MPTKKPKPQAHTLYHKDGSVWARGQLLEGVATGYWEWFRKDGVRMRSGHFEDGNQIGTWTTYDQRGAVYTVTTMKPKAK
jgi:antitoxin component YwqK of YwqJK toxin-antitoxin module